MTAHDDLFARASRGDHAALPELLARNPLATAGPPLAISLANTDMRSAANASAATFARSSAACWCHWPTR